MRDRVTPYVIGALALVGALTMGIGGHERPLVFGAGFALVGVAAWLFNQ